MHDTGGHDLPPAEAGSQTGRHRDPRLKPGGYGSYTGFAGFCAARRAFSRIAHEQTSNLHMAASPPVVPSPAEPAKAPRSGAIYVAHSVSCGVVIGQISSRGAAAFRTLAVTQSDVAQSFEISPLRGLRLLAPESHSSRCNGVNLARFRRGRAGLCDPLVCGGSGRDSDMEASSWRAGSCDWVGEEFFLRQLQRPCVDGVSGSHQRGEKETISGSLRMTTRTA